VKEFICAPPDTAYETTGTTSKKPKRVYFSRQEVREAGWSGAVGLWGLGVRADDRVASSFDYSFWVSGPVLQASCEVLGCFHVEAGRITPEEFHERLKDYGITVIVGDPSWIVRLSEIAEKKGTWPVKLLIAGGENMTEESRRYVEKVWKADFIISYGQTEAFGSIGIESRAKEGYHLNEFHNRFEIINRDPDGYGELVYTTLNRRVMPLIRYRSGDITKFLEGPSKSGLPGQRIAKLRGRKDEWIATAMRNLTPWLFEPVFGAIPDITEDWQVVILREGLKDLVEFHVESKDALIQKNI
jgi:phenylacetate-CoA ligase